MFSHIVTLQLNFLNPTASYMSGKHNKYRTIIYIYVYVYMSFAAVAIFEYRKRKLKPHAVIETSKITL